MANNYTLGRGELWFARYLAGTQNPGGERYLGNTPEFNATIESENLDHFNSDRGINEKDASIVLSTNRTGSFITDNIDPDNIALFFFGEKVDFTTTAAEIEDEVHSAVVQGLTYQLGITSQNPVGARALAVHTAGPPAVNVIVTDGASVDPVTYVEGEDYEIDLERGRITIVAGGAIASGTNISVTYRTQVTSRSRVISGTSAVEGSLRYIANNPAGSNFDWFMPYVKLSPNGDYALKGDEWQQIPFNIEILRKTGLEAIYIDGEPLIGS